ncbi:MAG: TetR/AcrR family transcriptional regulator [Paenibacillus macerans]|uniref:Bacterial regulatory s, tetR family protein n=1 Tax=Paenibacillus macerans TaxID=44252 RepID=A0A090Y7T9_PAEMA|nr:TetR/AcrR family transcriptional regulator [Paenibacillus macerans]KFM94256.1 bacterial regulatory s, tetR family protein [Paenibacillus macerans]MBS5910972.1 TetR/AcrR family transcriptional regulator [Paenibacillus macerans]MCY7558706.1 TetR/AcrR family transcriptional regulator [Paenibacillus macerans]MDU7473175.1 TetR/AcrR family transcriptional regulator [Paenibacillus macerans]MEC0139826.1 TetR/AcrR family transcriptional regulator [Paenibacillus macerans]
MSTRNHTRQILIETTAKLLQNQGYNATGLNQITQLSGTPKGSLYYHFPEGKEQLACEAVSHTKNVTLANLRSVLDSKADATQAVQELLMVLAEQVDRKNAELGIPLGVIAHETAGSNENIRKACCGVYNAWIAEFENKFVACGYAPEEAKEIAVSINALIEGSMIMCMTQRDSAPLRTAAKLVPRLLQA